MANQIIIQECTFLNIESRCILMITEPVTPVFESLFVRSKTSRYDAYKAQNS